MVLENILAEAFKNISVQYPMPADSDSIYAKDVWVENSITTGWVDEDSAGIDVALIPFTNLHTRIVNSTSDNPKLIRIHFNRTVFSSQISIGCIGTDDFSNVKITLLGSGLEERLVIDESSDGTKYTSRRYSFPNQVFNAVDIEFLTTDAVCISNITIQKTTGVSVDQVERTTNSLRVITDSQAHLNEGDHYDYKGYHTVSRNTSKDHLIITPNTDVLARMTIGVEAVTSSIAVQFYEDTTTSADGTVGNARNRNRNFGDDNTTEVYEDPTVTGVGTLLWSGFFGAGKDSAGGGARDDEQIILKKNTKYLLRVTENNISDTEVNFTFDWYEHEDIAN